MTDSKYVSDCCGAYVYVAGSPDLGAGVVTCYYECDECKQPCGRVLKGDDPPQKPVALKGMVRL